MSKKLEDIIITTITGISFYIAYNPNDSVQILKDKIIQKQGWNYNQDIKLIWAGKTLEERENTFWIERYRQNGEPVPYLGNRLPAVTLCELGIMQGSQIFLDHRLFY